MGSSIAVSEISYTPRQEKGGCVDGVIEKYELYLSMNGEKWEKISQGTFQNIYQTALS